MAVSSKEMVPASHPVLAMVGAGSAAGLIASLAVSALILLAEKVAMLPVGTFYLMLVSALSQSADYGISSMALGLLAHLLAGTVLGAVMTLPFALSKKAYGSLGRLAPAYGLGAGAAVWLVLFAPVTYGTMIPLMQSLEAGSEISQQAPVGDLSRVAVSDLLAMTDRVVFTALAFNMLYGLVVLVVARAIAGAALERRARQVIL
ncbi:hypothetical protein [Nitrososphaera sp.]|uniref:hypothetical protein n=1 Tax=Nitrososphaera sp. TaxID=1971748 RepID=UPI00307F0930